MGSPTRKLTTQMAEEEHKVLQTLVDETFKQFKEIVVEARPQLGKDPEALAKATTGQVFTAKQALDLGLVDKLGFIEDAVDRAISMAGLDPKDVRVVKYTRNTSLFDALDPVPSATANRGVESNLGTLADLASPRAYYLWTWLPAAVANRNE